MNKAKSISTVLICLIMAIGLSFGEAHAKKKSKKIADAIAVGIGVAALAAIAASSANAHRNRDDYDYHHGHSSRQNAVSACLHRAHRKVAKRGGSRVTIKRVLSTRSRGGDRWDVAIRVKTRGPWGKNTRNAKCRVKHDRVRRFSWY